MGNNDIKISVDDLIRFYYLKSALYRARARYHKERGWNENYDETNYKSDIDKSLLCKEELKRKILDIAE